MNKELHIYNNSSKLMSSLFGEINDILSKRVNFSEIKKLNNFKKKFEVTKKSIIESIKYIKLNELNKSNESNKSDDRYGTNNSQFTDLDTLNINQIKINIIGIEGIIKSKENFHNNYANIKEYNTKIYQISCLAYHESVKEIIFNKYPKTKLFSDNKILENKKILYSLENKYQYTFFQKFHEMKNKNNTWIKEINNEIQKEYEYSKYIINELNKNLTIIKNEQSNNRNNQKGKNSDLTSKLLFIEEEIPNNIYYANKLVKSLN